MLLRTTVFSSGRTVRPIAPRMFRALPDGQPRFLPAARVNQAGARVNRTPSDRTAEHRTLRPPFAATKKRIHGFRRASWHRGEGTGHLSSWISSRTSAPVRLGPQPLADNGCKGGGAILF